MYQQQSLVAEVSPELFSQFLDTLWAHLKQQCELAADAPPEGIGESPARGLPVEYAVQRDALFAAFRWHDDHGRSEAFFVKPAKGNARMAASRIRPGASAGAELDMPWWSEMLQLAGASTPEAPAKPVPGFLELSALLASGGTAPLSNLQAALQIEQLQHERDYFESLADDQSDELRHVRARLRSLSEVSVQQPSPEVRDPATAATEVADLRGLPEWAKANEDRIVILPRALGAAKKSLYETPSAVYAALEYLAGAYRDHRLNRISRSEHEKALTQPGLRVAGSAKPTIAGAQGDAYYVNWGGRKRFLEFHVLKGGGRDERYCMRVYFFWDDESSRPVVGWLPSHLDNSLT